MRRAFTLIELLVIIAIMGAMVSVSVVSFRAGQGAVRIRGAARDIFAVIRHARSTALVTGQPAVITYSCVKVDDEVMAKIEVHSKKLQDTERDRGAVQTLSGEPLKGSREAVHIEEATETAAKKAAGNGETVAGDSIGTTVEDVLFAPISEDVVKGMRIKVEMGDQELDVGGTEQRKSRISVFSNVDYLLGSFQKERKQQAEAKQAEAAASGTVSTLDEPLQEEVSVVWETNGRVDPHKVWVYADGSKPESGLCIKIDRFGAAKVISGDGRDDDD